MKRLIALMAILLLSVGVSYASGIPTVVSPQNYPTVWTETVYNGSGSDISTGMVVLWDFDTANSNIDDYDDMCPWVKTADEADSVWVAGVSLISQGISNATSGQIIIRGPAVVQDGAGESQCTVNTITGFSASGYAANVSQNGSDDGYLGITIKTTATNQGYSEDALIYVNPTMSDDD